MSQLILDAINRVSTQVSFSCCFSVIFIYIICLPLISLPVTWQSAFHCFGFLVVFDYYKNCYMAAR